jgi:xanthosine utilization system XapX-like protein
MTVRRALTGLAVGLVVGALAATVAWKLRQGPARPFMAAAGVVGLIVGTAVAIRRRWSDTEVALYLDGRLESDEAITTAVELRSQAEEDEVARAVVVTKAVKVLESGNPKRVRPSLFSAYHALIPVGAAALVFVSMIELPTVPVPPPEPGADLVRVADIEALDKVMELGRLDSPDPEQRERLKKIAEDAKKLKERLAEGMERREAQSEIARLRDALAAERARMSSAEQRAGLEAAHGRLAKEKMLKDAAKALGDRDLTKFDEEMQKLANQLEKQDREAAKKALEEAAEEAKKKGAKDVAKLLEEQKKLLEERSKRGEALREFADAFGDDPDVKEQLEQFEKDGTDANGGKLAERMADALKNLTPEERKRLAERLKEQLKNDGGQMDPMTKEQLEDLADELDTPEGQKRLEDMLREMANEPPDSGEAERDRALGDAEKGLGEAEKGLGAPMPIPGAPKAGCNKPGCSKPGCSGGCDGKGSQPGSGKGDPSDGSGQGGPGSHHDKGRGDHAGSTPEVEGDGFRSRAGGKLNPGAPMPGVVTGRGKGRPGESANVRGIDGIGEAAPGEVGGVERSEIPEEYREHIGRYFSP